MKYPCKYMNMSSRAADAKLYNVSDSMMMMMMMMMMTKNE